MDSLFIVAPNFCGVLCLVSVTVIHYLVSFIILQSLLKGMRELITLL